jgi:Zn-dependent oligopeptidase
MLFHELGHDMAAMLATAPYETLSSGFRDGFADAPAQMLENFAWQPEILKRITFDVRTGAPMPDDLIAKLVASRSTDDAYETARLLMLSLFDIRAHSAGPHVDTTALWKSTAEGPPPLRDAPGAHPIAFDRLTSGYDTGLYARAWAQVYAQDLFTAFAGGLLLDPATWMRYRQDVLAPARTYEPDAEVMRFLGRPERPAAFYAEYGLSCC